MPTRDARSLAGFTQLEPHQPTGRTPMPRPSCRFIDVAGIHQDVPPSAQAGCSCDPTEIRPALPSSRGHVAGRSIGATPKANRLGELSLELIYLSLEARKRRQVSPPSCLRVPSAWTQVCSPKASFVQVTSPRLAWRPQLTDVAVATTELLKLDPTEWSADGS